MKIKSKNNLVFVSFWSFLIGSILVGISFFIAVPSSQAAVFIEDPVPLTLLQKNTTDCMPTSVGMVIHQSDTSYLENLAHSKGWYNNGEPGGGADGIVGLSHIVGKKTISINSLSDFKHVLKIGWSAVLQVYYGNTTHAFVASHYDDKTNTTYIRDPWKSQESGYKNINDLWNRKSYTSLDIGYQGSSWIGVGWYSYVGGGIGNVYENNRQLARPTSGEWKSNLGMAQTFQNGRLYWVRNSGKVYIVKDILQAYKDVGYGKYLGDPTGNISNGYQQFQNGVLNNKGLKLDLSNGGYFLDVIGYNNDENIKWLANNNIVFGTSQFTFSPKKSLTREQMSIIISRYLNIWSEKVNCFSDIGKQSIEFQKSVCGLKEKGIILGTGDNKYSPTKKVTREQMAVMLKRIAFSQDKEGILPIDNNCFSDIKKSAHRYDICWLKANNISRGVGDGKYSPAGAVSRGQTATFIHLLDENVINKDL
ncbi:MAG: S-layer homology domain-containing protein [Bifidobacteriaceae bacterium]|jgi:hypothetical protein|nr:S-layer homology domain-containing protein [Bifidobacteriaceae bacterium]